MAKLEMTKALPIDELAKSIEKGILDGSSTATLEERVDYTIGDTRCVIMVFECYTFMGRNRVSLHVTLLQPGSAPVQVCAITSGGSQAMFYKVNTFGEESFLDCLADILR